MTLTDFKAGLPSPPRFIRTFSQGLVKGWQKIRRDRMATVYFTILSVVLIMGTVGPMITPFEYNENLYGDDGELERNLAPSMEHPLGTTYQGYDVLSRVLFGARPTILAGLLGGAIIISLGGAIGITAGYSGGKTEDLLMRFTDFMYGVPLIPFAIVLLAFVGMGWLEAILVIGLVLWRSSARILRSQVIQIKERPFIMSAKATGASNLRIIVKHIIPNIAPMAVLLFSLGVGYAVITQASLAFIGVVNPFIPSWGVMLRNAYNSGVMSIAWWWALAPGLLLSLTVLSTFMLGRKLVKEEDQSSQTLTEGGGM